jgi:hypothetical protein
MYSQVSSPDPRNEGVVYALDAANDRFLAFEKPGGRYIRQFRIAGGGPDWADVRGFFVANRAAGQSPVLWWVDRDRLMSAALEPVAVAPSPGPSASTGPAATPTPAPTRRPTPRPTKRPTPKP